MIQNYTNKICRKKRDFLFSFGELDEKLFLKVLVPAIKILMTVQETVEGVSCNKKI